MLPAGNGDALWIEYGSQEAPNRILVDSGRKDTAKHLIDRVAELGTPQFELFVMTHIDSDHIGGAIPFLQAPEMGATFNDIWFNGWKQLRGFLAVREGELFSKVLSDPERGFPWNRAVTNSAHEVPQPIVVPEGGTLPRVTLDGGMELTLLSPSPKDLHRLALDWQQALKELDPDRLLRARRPAPIDDLSAFRLEPLAEKKPNSDRSKANGSSIAFLAEYGGRSVLLTGDAHVGGLVKSIRALLRERKMEGEKLSVDALKISHHGSANGLTKALLNLVECPRYLVSTNGDTHYHPDREAMARAVLWGGDEPTLHFNYRTDFNDMWGSPELTERYEYRAVFPDEGREGLRVAL
jgi:beta-lactamase superfamily II metal-dependent hydrolase